MTYSIVYEGVTLCSIPCESIEFQQTSFGLEAIVAGANPTPLVSSLLELLHENSLIRSLNLSEEHFVFWIVDGFVKA